MASSASDLGEAPSPPAVGLEPALTAALQALPESTWAEISASLRQASLDSGFTWERRDGGYDPVPLMVRPRVWTRRQAEFVRDACLALQSGLSRLLAAWLQDEAVREVLPLGAYEEERVRALAASGPALHDQHLFSRLDAIIDTTSPRWHETLAFLEPNVVGVGGTRYTALGERLWSELVKPHLADCGILPPLDSRDLLLECLRDRARALGLREPVRLALVEDLRESFGTNELRLIAEHFRSRGVPAHHVDVRSLSYDGAQLCAEGQPVDLVYRFPELRELEELDSGEALAPLWRAFAENRVVSTLGGDFDHKSSFELFTSPRFAKYFTELERRVFRQHVLWTRLLSERRTEGPAGEEIELVRYARENRESLVLKPNRSYGGQGVSIGPELDARAWQVRLDEALGQPGAWVVQAFRALPRQSFPVHREGGWGLEELLMVCGFFATPRGVTSMGRVSAAAVVNLTQRGASLVPQVCVPG